MRGSAKSMFRGEAVRVAGDTALVWHEDSGSLAVVTLDTGDCAQADNTDNTLDTGDCDQHQADNTQDTGDCAQYQADNTSGDCDQYQADNTDNSRGDCMVYHSNNTGLRNGRLLDYCHPHLLLAGYDGAGAGRLEVWRVDHAARTSAANRLIGEVVQSRRRPLLGPSPG